MTYDYKVLPRPLKDGGGWRLQLLEDGVEVGGEVFTLADFGFADDALQAARKFAEAEGELWLSSRRLERRSKDRDSRPS